jgi:general secretion pathway protein G
MTRSYKNYARRIYATRAFTFIEIMVVVIIIGLLISMGGVAWMTHLKNAQVKITRAKIKGTLRTELDLYYTTHGSYPTSDQGLRVLIEDAEAEGEDLEDLLKDPWGSEFLYECPGKEGRKYDLWSLGPDKQDGTGDEIGNWKSEDDK